MPSLNTGNAILSNAITVDGSYNVGIGGAVDASYKLKVTGASLLTGDLTLNNGNADGAQLILTSSGFSNWNLDNYSGNFRWYYGATEWMRLTSDGNLGINTTSPITFTNYNSISVNGTEGGAFVTMSNGTSALRLLSGSTDSALWEPRNVPVLFATNNAERMRITSSGNVGIGTSSPSGLFEVLLPAFTNEDTSSQMAIFGSGSNGRGVRIGYSQANSSGYIYSLNPGVAWQDLKFAGNNMIFCGGGSIERMRITSGGGIMIGTSSDTGRRLYVLGSTSNSSAWNSTFDNSSGGTIIGFRNDGLISTGGTLSYSPYNLTITPGRALYVDSSGTLGYVASVRESKTNINALKSVEWVKNLNPVSFNYRKKDENNQYTDEFSDDVFYGLIADEVEKIDSNLVFYDVKENGVKELKGVYYEKLTAVLIKAIQELSAKVTAQQQQINQLINK